MTLARCHCNVSASCATAWLFESLSLKEGCALCVMMCSTLVGWELVLEGWMCILFLDVHSVYA